MTNFQPKPKLPLHTAFVLLVGAVSLSACDGSATISQVTDTAPQVTPVAIAIESESAEAGDDVAGNDAAGNDVVAGDEETNDVVLTSDPAVSVADFLQEVVDDKGTFRLMAMGDSITQGVRGASSFRLELKNLMSVADCPVVYVGSQSAASPDVGFYTAHEGYSGHSTQDFLNGRGSNAGAANNVSYHKPDIVLLHVGSVDIWRGFDVAETVSRICLLYTSPSPRDS